MLEDGTVFGGGGNGDGGKVLLRIGGAIIWGFWGG